MNIVNKQITNPIAILHKPIIHHSLTTGSVPNYMKLATITPILNKSNSTSFSVANYHPISNLSTHSKILERVVSKQLSAYMISIKIPSIFQSAYLPQTNPLKQHLPWSHQTYYPNSTTPTDLSSLYLICLRPSIYSSKISFCIDCPLSELMVRP